MLLLHVSHIVHQFLSASIVAFSCGKCDYGCLPIGPDKSGHELIERTKFTERTISKARFFKAHFQFRLRQPGIPGRAGIRASFRLV
jgi:hypothetical protein